jgi:NAD+ synthase
MRSGVTLSPQVLDLDCGVEVQKIGTRIREALARQIHRRGLVIAMSGGIDSSVSAALAVQAIGVKKVFGLLLPERDSSSSSLRLGQLLAKHLGIEYIVQDIAPTLDAIGCYQWRDDAIRKAFPEYGQGWKNKIVIVGGMQGKYNHFKLVVQSPQGEVDEKTLALKEYLTIVAATNYKQRIRKTIEYFHADRLNYAVVGTPNRLEYDQGFFVKNGDGSADIKPIAHLYKTQVYALARYLQLPADICAAIPTTDTYSLKQGQDEFYFGLPYQTMDMALWAYNQNVAVEDLANFLEISQQDASAIYKDIATKRRTTRYLHQSPVLMEDIDLINAD